MSNKNGNNSEFERFKILLETLKVLRDSSRWVTPELAIYVQNYMEQHPGKKLTYLQRRKLELDFYRENRKKRKESQNK